MTHMIGATDESVPTFEELRKIWTDPQWLDLSGRALDRAPRKTFLVLDPQAIHTTSASTLEALTNPSLGNIIVLCELCFDIFDSQRKSHGNYGARFERPEARQRSGTVMQLSTQLRKMLGDPEKYGIHLQHVREYDKTVINNEQLDVRSIDSLGLLVACASYFNRPSVRQISDIEHVLLVSDSPKLRSMALRYHVPSCASAELLTISATNAH